MGQAAQTRRIETILRMWDATDAHDFSVLDEVIHPDVRITSGFGEACGIDAYRGFVRTMYAALPDMRHRLVRSVEHDTQLALEVEIDGTFTGDLVLGEVTVPASGKPVHLMGADLITFGDDDRVVDWTIYFAADVPVQLGLA